jgi:hypothetical protein
LSLNFNCRASNDSDLDKLLVYAIAQDSNGLIWFGSEKGLSYYDGYSNTAIELGQFKVKSIINVYCDLQNRIWFGTSEGEIGIVDKNKVYTTKSLSIIPPNGEILWSISENPEDQSLLLYRGGQLYRCKDSSYTVLSNKLLNASGYSFYYKGNSYLAEGSNVWKINNSTLSVENKISKSQKISKNENILGLAITENNIYYKSGTNIWHYDLDMGSVRSFVNLGKKNKESRAFVTTHFLSLKDTLWQFSPKGLTYRKTIENRLNTIFEDRIGNIWLAYKNGGLEIVRSSKTVVNFTPIGIEKEQIIYQTDARYLYSVTAFTLSQFDLKTNRIIRTSLSQKEYDRIDIIEDQCAILRRDQKNYFYPLGTSTSSHYEYQRHLEGKAIKKIFSVGENTFIGTHDGLYQFRAHQFIQRILSKRCTGIESYSKDEIVIRSSHNIFIYHINKKELTPYRSESINQPTIFTSNEKYFVMANSRGDLVLHNKSETQDTKKYQLPITESVLDLIIYKKRFLAMTENRIGIYELDKNTFRFKYEIDKNVLKHLNNLKGVEVVDGILVLMCSNGFYAINDLENFQTQKKEGYKLIDSKLPVTLNQEVLTNKAGNNDIVFKVFSSDYYQKELFYKIEGHNQEIKAANKNLVLESNLQPGTYTISIYEGGLGGYQKVLTLDGKIPYTITDYAWFWPGIIALIGFFSFLTFYNYHTSREQKLRLESELIKLRMSTFALQINPHFLYNTLNSLQVLIRTGSSDAVKFVSKLSRFFSKILSSLDNDFISLEDEIGLADKYLVLEKLRFKDKLTWDFDIDREVDMGSWVPPFILQPFVENSIKHGFKNGKPCDIVLKVSTINDRLILILEDNCGGISEVMNPDSTYIGLDNIKKRLSSLNRTYHRDMDFSIQNFKIDDENKGLRIKITI